MKARTARKKVDEKSCVTPAGTSNELDVQNEWEENTHTHTRSLLAENGRKWVLANQIRPTTLSPAIVFRYTRFRPKKHRELPFLAIAHLKTPSLVQIEPILVVV